MRREQVDAWMFLAAAYGRLESGLAPLAAVIGTADAINHLVPNDDELVGGMNRLIHAGLLIEERNAFGLTEAGEALLAKSQSADYVTDQWDRLSSEMSLLEDPPTQLWVPSTTALSTARSEYLVAASALLNSIGLGGPATLAGGWPTKFDDQDWHVGGVFPADTPAINGFTHIGMYYVWIIRHDLHARLFLPPHVVSGVKAGTLTAHDLADECDGKLVDDMLSAAGKAFTDAYYNSEDGYLEDWARTFEDQPEYGVRDTPESFARIEEVLDRRYVAWRAGKSTRTQ